MADKLKGAPEKPRRIPVVEPRSLEPRIPDSPVSAMGGQMIEVKPIKAREVRPDKEYMRASAQSISAHDPELLETVVQGLAQERTLRKAMSAYLRSFGDDAIKPAALDECKLQCSKMLATAVLVARGAASKSERS